MASLTGQIGLRRNSTGFIGKCIEWATNSTTHHVVVAVSETVCISAEPKGVRFRNISDYPHLDWSRFDHDGAARERIIDAAWTYRRRPYNFAIYIPLLWRRLTGAPVSPWLARWLAQRPNENCSQLAADIYRDAGFKLFDQSADIITPGDWERLFAARAWL